MKNRHVWAIECYLYFLNAKKKLIETFWCGHKWFTAFHYLSSFIIHCPIILILLLLYFVFKHTHNIQRQTEFQIINNNQSIANCKLQMGSNDSNAINQISKWWLFILISNSISMFWNEREPKISRNSIVTNTKICTTDRIKLKTIK